MTIEDLIEEFCDLHEEIDFVTDHTADHLIVTVDQMGNPQSLTVTADDVIEYYRTQASNITSGIRVLAGLAGDWRPVDELARFCLSYFKFIDRDGFHQKCIDAGLIPKF